MAFAASVAKVVCWTGTFKQVVKALACFIGWAAAFMITMATGVLPEMLAENSAGKKWCRLVLLFLRYDDSRIAAATGNCHHWFLLVGLGRQYCTPLYSTAVLKGLQSSRRYCHCNSEQALVFRVLMGPPLIGYIAQLPGWLQYSFMSIAFLGLGISYMVRVQGKRNYNYFKAAIQLSLFIIHNSIMDSLQSSHTNYRSINPYVIVKIKFYTKNF